MILLSLFIELFDIYIFFFLFLEYTFNCEKENTTKISRVYLQFKICMLFNIFNLNELQEIIKEREEEREKLRKELRRSRERIHALDTDVQRREFSEVVTTTTHTQTATG